MAKQDTGSKTQMECYIRANIGKGATVGRMKGSTGPFSAPHRDLIHCLGVLVGEAIALTQAAYEADHEQIQHSDVISAADTLRDQMEALDTISKLFLEMHRTIIVNNGVGLARFRELYDYVDGSPAYGEVYARFCMFFFQAVLAYLFSAQSMALGAEEVYDPQDLVGMTAVSSILSVLDTDARREALDRLVQTGHWPTTVDTAPLRKRLDDFLSIIKEDQQRRYKTASESSSGGA